MEKKSSMKEGIIMSRKEDAMQCFKQLFNEDILVDDPEFKDIIVNYIYGDVYQHGTLDIQTRELILIVVNTTNMTLKALKEHVKAGLRVHLQPEHIKEAVYQCTPYIGLGKVEEALDVVNEVMKEEGIELPLKSMSTVNEETRFDEGLKIQVNTFGERIIEGHKNAPQELKHIQNYLSAYCFGDFYTRQGLDMKIRELLTFVMIASLGGCESQLRGHTAGNLAVGNTRDILIEAMTQCQPYIGFPRTLNAIQIINEVTQ